jgi:hypothetical protein
MVPETHPVTLFSVSTRTTKRLHQIIVLEDVEGLFKGLEIIRAEQDKRRSPVPSNQDTVVLALDPVGQFREVGLDFRERNRVAHLEIV